MRARRLLVVAAAAAAVIIGALVPPGAVAASAAAPQLTEPCDGEAHDGGRDPRRRDRVLRRGAGRRGVRHRPRPAAERLGHELRVHRPLLPDRSGLEHFDGLQRNTGVHIDASGNVWLANNWKTVPGAGNQYGDGLVVFIGAAAPIAMPLVGTPQPP